MTKEGVIAWRDKLKCGEKNYPLKIYSDNDFAIIDESSPFAFTKWDDTLGVIFYLRLIDPDRIHEPNNKDAISIASIDYTFIQSMEVAPCYISNGMLDNIMAAIGVKEELQERIRNVFTRALTNSKPMTRAEINSLHGAQNVADTGTNYYGDNFRYPYRETAVIDQYNKSISG